MPTTDALLTFLGRLHPVMVHFPIGLLLAAAAIELVRWGKPQASPSSVTCTWLGLLGAGAAIGCGWLYAQEASVDSANEHLFLHRWIGVAAGGTALIAALLGWRARSGSPDQPSGAGAYRKSLGLVALLVGVTAHFGGEMTYGEGFFTEALFETPRRTGRASAEPAADAKTEPSTEPSTEPTPTPTPETPDPEPDPAAFTQPAPVDFVDEVLPIFESVCYRCHGPTGRAKGMLRLSDVTQLFSDDPSYPVVIPGDAAGSPLVWRISLPPDHEDVMPPNEEPLTAEQIATITRWVDEGAPHPERP